MNTHNSLIGVSAWLALVFYVLSEVSLRVPLRHNEQIACWLGVAGWGALVLHICLAFHFRYGWSQSSAYADTARQTAALTGWNSGFGIYANYAFALVWLLDLALSRVKRGLIVARLSKSQMAAPRVLSLHVPQRWSYFRSQLCQMDWDHRMPRLAPHMDVPAGPKSDERIRLTPSRAYYLG